MKAGAIRLGLALVICVILTDGTAAQKSERQYFEGKTITLTVPYSPGGGYDIYARMVVPYLKKYMHTNLIVQNKPGAGGVTALNTMTVSLPDGLQLSLINGNGAAVAQILQEPSVRYDLGKFDYLAGAGIAPDVWLFAPQLHMTSVKQAIKLTQTIRWGSTGATDILSVGAAITCQTFHLKCRIIMGYPGAANVALALARDEVDAMIVSDGAAVTYVNGGSADIVATMAKKRSKYFPASPTIYEAEDLSHDARWWMDFRADLEVLSKVFIGPPGMPEARLSYLRSMMKLALTDPELIADGEKRDRPVEYQDPASIKQAVSTVISRFTDSDKQKIRSVIGGSYIKY